ncbi:hypothetical protein [Bradyrhizobium uaiense]|uniref:Uncharacterized protein n=1 Tax=Bradyrhizobium uaiense TaxID=2594946 RepID=A0A6P1BB29_9BRAD|nr:hypothetical protein [Bradyrhizobium uaiense]NEU95666.1 hypothetical protein [Bradyrhizobium uaiense]
MRELVRMNLALRAYTHSDLCAVLINPATGDPISLQTFARCFAREIKTAKIELDNIASGGFVKQLRRGNMTAFIWYSKTQWGWSERKGRPVQFELPALNTAADIVSAQAAISAAMSAGTLTPTEATEVSAVVELHRKAIETAEHEAFIEKIEEGMALDVEP